jgi:hypothetical protein
MSSPKNLQAMIDATLAGETLVLPPGEYEGPVSLSRNIVLEGAKSTIWSRKGPVMHLKAQGTRLCGLRIEVTRFDEDMANKPEHVALLVDPGVNVVLEDVIVRGYVVGINGENGVWLVPPSIDLGFFSPRQVNTFALKLYVPVKCQISTSITGLSITPSTLAPGENVVVFTAKNIYPDTLLLGRCYLHSARIMRPIDITGRAASDESVLPTDHRLLWEPSRMPTQSSGCAQQSDGNTIGEYQISEQWLADEIVRLIRAGVMPPHGGLVRER